MVRPGRGNGWRFPFSQATPTTNEATTTDPRKWSTRGWRQGIEREPRDFTSQPKSGKPKRRQPSGGDVSEYEEEVEIKQRHQQGEECWQGEGALEGQAGEIDPMQIEELPAPEHGQIGGQQFSTCIDELAKSQFSNTSDQNEQADESTVDEDSQKEAQTRQGNHPAHEVRELAELGIQLRNHLTKYPEDLDACCAAMLKTSTTTRQARQTCKELLPMPVPSPSAAEYQAGPINEGEQAWMWLTIMALNAGYVQNPGNVGKMNEKPSSGQIRCFQILRRQVEHFVSLPIKEEKITDWQVYLKSKKLSYEGEVIQVAEEMTWEQVEAALPSKTACGRIDAVGLADGPMKEYLLNPQNALEPRPRDERRPRPGKIHIPDNEKIKFANGLLERGLVSVVKCSELIQFADGPLTNGTFGVKKGKQLSDGREVLRWIINLTATNTWSRKLDTDIRGLPYMCQWRHMVLEADEDLAWSWDDMKGCFYLFQLPPGWAPLFTLNWPIAPKDIGLECDDEVVYLGLRVLPMGFCNSMDIVQYLHRRMLLLNSGGPQTALPIGREIRKDRPFPVMGSELDELQAAWQVYCDDFDSPMILKGGQLKEWAKEETEFQQSARAAYEEWEVETTDKSGSQQYEAERLGVYINGRRGYVGPSGDRVMKIIGMTQHILTNAITQKELQIVLGHWGHVTQMRREVMACFHFIWQRMIKWGTGRKWLDATGKREFYAAMCLLPLMVISLRQRYSPMVTASDASEQGGGVCKADELEENHRRKVGVEVNRVCSTGRDQVGLISVNLGLGQIRRAFDLLGVEIAVHMACDNDECCRDIVKQAWPDVQWVADHKHMTGAALSRLREQHPHVEMIFLWIEVSPVATRSEGWKDFWTDMEELMDLTKKTFKGIQVACCLEGKVAAESGTQFESKPMKINWDMDQDSDQKLRRYWIDWNIEASEEVLIEAASGGREITMKVGEAGLSENRVKDRRRTGEYRLQRLGFDLDHCLAGVHKEESKRAQNAAVMALTDKGSDCHVWAWLVGQRLHKAKVLSHAPNIQWCRGGLSPEEEVLMKKRFKVEDPRDVPELEKEKVKQVFRGSIHRGSDVRMAGSSLLNPMGWPRKAFAVNEWKWKTVLAYQQSGEHINVLECKAALAGVRWRLRKVENLETKFAHLLDSQVVMGVVAKGRSSSMQLRRIIRKLNSLLLASGCSMAVIYVRSAQNPADRPSRWGSGKC